MEIEVLTPRAGAVVFACADLAHEVNIPYHLHNPMRCCKHHLTFRKGQ